MEEIEHLSFEISRKEDELKKLKRQLHHQQRNKIFDSLVEGHYYKLTTDKTWYRMTKTFYFKYTGKNVEIKDEVGEYLDIKGKYIEDYSCDEEIEGENRYRVVHEWSLNEDLHHYLGDNEPEISELSEEKLADFKKKLTKIIEEF